jgi:hypothetical protein
MVRSGFIGTDFKIIDYDKVYDRWEAIPNPYDVFKQLKKTAVDIKTDFNYPNAFRPEKNPGYNTKYDPK